MGGQFEPSSAVKLKNSMSVGELQTYVEMSIDYLDK